MDAGNRAAFQQVSYFMDDDLFQSPLCFVEQFQAASDVSGWSVVILKYDHCLTMTAQINTQLCHLK